MQFANLTTSVAGQLYGNGSTEQNAVAKAWVKSAFFKIRWSENG